MKAMGTAMGVKMECEAEKTMVKIDQLGEEMSEKLGKITAQNSELA